MASKLGISDRVTFTGLIPNTVVADYVAAADVFALPSLLEALPTVAVEALASGTPVISSDNPGGVELSGLFADDIVIVPRESAEARDGARRVSPVSSSNHGGDGADDRATFQSSRRAGRLRCRVSERGSSVGMNVLVTGGAGFLGLECVRQLRAAGHTPISTDRRAPADVHVDLTDASATSRLPDVNAIVHAAAVQYVSHNLPWLNRRSYFLANNVTAMVNLVRRYSGTGRTS